MRHVQIIGVIMACAAIAYGQTNGVQEDVIRDAFAGRAGSLVLVDCSTGVTNTFRPENAAIRLAPCSTFKIWNTLIGLEAGIIASPDQAFYQWDGEKR